MMSLKGKIEIVGQTDVGSVRDHNEDALYTIVDTNTMKDCTNCIADFKNKIGYK